MLFVDRLYDVPDLGVVNMNRPANKWGHETCTVLSFYGYGDGLVLFASSALITFQQLIHVSECSCHTDSISRCNA
jgi:hypothetical protein